MSKHRLLGTLVVAISLLAAVAGTSWAATTTEKRSFEVISVDGNKVVFRGEEGVREMTLPDDFKLTMDGKEIGLADLRPGMTGTATITTTTTSVPVTMTELMDAEVMAVAGNAIIVKMNDGFHKFTQEDVNERNITIVREGERVELHQLRQGDRLTAKVITQKEPKIVTEQDVKAVIDSAASGAASAPAAQGAPAAGSAPSTADPAAEKTGLSTLAWVGIVVLALIVILFLLRRPRKA